MTGIPPSHGAAVSTDGSRVVSSRAGDRVTSHCLGPEGPRATRLTSICPDSHVVPPTAEGQGESYLTVQVTSWDQFTFPEPPTCISLIKSCSSNPTPGHVSGENS